MTAIGILAAVFGYIGCAKGRRCRKAEGTAFDESQFYDFLIGLADSLDAGNNIVNTICGINGDLPEGKVKQKMLESEGMLMLNYGLDEVFSRFSESFSSSLIKNWSRMIIISYRNGADLRKAIRDNRDLFVLNRRVRKETRAITARQRFNLVIIKFMPFLILAILSGSAPEFSGVLYSPNGRVVMTVAFILVLIADWIAERMAEI